jgi:hypothetical protein
MITNKLTNKLFHDCYLRRFYYNFLRKSSESFAVPICCSIASNWFTIEKVSNLRIVKIQRIVVLGLIVAQFLPF